MHNQQLVRVLLIMLPALIMSAIGILIYVVVSDSPSALPAQLNVVQTRDAAMTEQHQATALWRYLAYALVGLSLFALYKGGQYQLERWRCQRWQQQPCRICGRLQRRLNRQAANATISCQCYPAYTGLTLKSDKKSTDYN